MMALFYYLGRTLQVSGLVLGLLVIVWFFNPANGMEKLLMLTALSAGIFYGGHFLITTAGHK